MSVEAEAALPGASRSYAGFAVFALALVLAGTFVFGHEPSGAARMVPDKWLNKDGTFYFLTLRTLIDHRTLEQDQTQPRSWYEADLQWNRSLPPDWSDVAVGRGGHWYPKHPILMPLATVPLFLAFGAYGPLLLNLLALALLPVLAYRLGLRVAPWGAALAAAALLASSAFLTEQGYGYSNDLFYALLVMLAYDAAFAEKPISTGIWFSLSVFAKSTNALFAVPLGLCFLLRKDLKGLIRFAIASAPGLVLYAGLNTFMFGAPWRTGYNSVLVRVNGHQELHDVAHDFDWGHFGHLLHERLMSAPGASNTFNMWDRAPWWFLAVPGALVALWRAPKLAIPLLLGIVPLTLLLAPFQYFRVEFLNAPVALAVPLIAALLVPWVKKPAPPPLPSPSRVRWDRLGPALAVVILVVASFARAALPDRGGYFEKHLTDAHVQLGPIPCDYFNWQVQRFECSNFDRGQDEVMTGRSLRGLPRFGGHPEPLLSLAPHPLRAPRRITWKDFDFKQKVEVRYGFADGAAPRGHVTFRAFINGAMQELPLGGAGELKTAQLDTEALAGQKGEIAFEVSSDAGADVPVYFDGESR
jgi:hypothetical protein